MKHSVFRLRTLRIRFPAHIVWRVSPEVIVKREKLGDKMDRIFAQYIAEDGLPYTASIGVGGTIAFHVAFFMLVQGQLFHRYPKPVPEEAAWDLWCAMFGDTHSPTMYQLSRLGEAWVFEPRSQKITFTQ